MQHFITISNSCEGPVQRLSLLCSDTFRDYEADYSATLSAEEGEIQEEEGGRKRWEADEEEEGRGKLTLGMLVCSSSPLPSKHAAVLFFYAAPSYFHTSSTCTSEG